MRNSYHAEMVNVTNVYQEQSSYMSAVMVLAQWSDASIILYGPSEEVLYYNNRSGSLDAATKQDTLNLSSVAAYLDGIYEDVSIVHNAIKRCYKDLKPTKSHAVLLRGGRIDFEIYPAMECLAASGLSVLKCIVVIGTLRPCA